MPGPNKGVGGSGVGMMNRVSRDTDQPATKNKYEGIMGWGTPRLVTCNRLKAMDANQKKSADFLKSMANARKGVTEM